MNASKSRIAIIGANGNMGLKRIQALMHSRGADFCKENLVLCDIANHQIKKLELELPLKNSAAEILNDPSISHVIISTPNSRARDQMLLAALEKGKHILIEKPLAMNRDVIEKANRLVGKKQGSYKSAYNLEYFPSIQKLKTDRNRLGPLRMIHTFYGNGWFNPLQEVQGWVRDPELPSGVEYFMGCHMVSLLWLFAESHKIIDRKIHATSSRFPNITDNAVISIQLESLTFNAIVSWVYWKNIFNIHLLGSDGLATVDSLVKYIKYGQAGEKVNLIERQKGMPKETSSVFTYENVDPRSADLEFLDIEMNAWLGDLESGSFSQEAECKKNLFIHECLAPEG